MAAVEAVFSPLPEGPYATIVADPPWDYSRKLSGGGTSGYSPVHPSRGGNRGAANHYSTLRLEQLEKLPVQSVAADQAHLYLWTTSAFIVEAHVLADSLGIRAESRCAMDQNQAQESDGSCRIIW